MSEKQQVPSAGPDFVTKLPQDQCGDVRGAEERILAALTGSEKLEGPGEYRVSMEAKVTNCPNKGKAECYGCTLPLLVKLPIVSEANNYCADDITAHWRKEKINDQERAKQ